MQPNCNSRHLTSMRSIYCVLLPIAYTLDKLLVRQHLNAYTHNSLSTYSLLSYTSNNNKYFISSFLEHLKRCVLQNACNSKIKFS